MPAGATRSVAQHFALVRSIAARVKRSLGASAVDLDDLVQYGTTGLLEAADRYDARRGVMFATFAYHRILGAIYDGLRRMGGLPRHVYTRVRAAETGDECHGEEQRAQDPLRQVMRVMRGVATVVAAAEAAQPERVATDEEAARRQLAERVRAAVATLPERERHFIERHYFQDRSLTEAGAELGLSKSWASRLHARAVDLLREKLKRSG